MKRIWMIIWMVLLVGCTTQETSKEQVDASNEIIWISPIAKDMEVCFKAYMEEGEEIRESSIEQIYGIFPGLKEGLTGYTVDESNIGQVDTKEHGSVYYGYINTVKAEQKIAIGVVHQSSLEASYWLKKYDVQISEPMMYAYENQDQIQIYFFDHSYILDLNMSGFTKAQAEAWLQLLYES